MSRFAPLGALWAMKCGENGVPPVVECAAVGEAVPLHIVVAPLAAIDRVGAWIDVVAPVVAGDARAGGVGRDRAGIDRKIPARIKSVAGHG